MASEPLKNLVADDATIVPKPSTSLKPYQQLRKLYALPVPLRTYPLPTFVPHNPLSLFHVLYTWISHSFFPPSSHPQTLYEAWFSPESQSVHVAEEKTILVLWRQGFFGKGSLSRSELSWLERERRRRGDAAHETSEEYTSRRRAERQQIKWERARKEREAIDLKLEEERKALEAENVEQVTELEEPLQGNQHPSPDDSTIQRLKGERNGKLIRRRQFETHAAPIDPMQLLNLPNSEQELLLLNFDMEMGHSNEEREIRRKEDFDGIIAEVGSLIDEATNGMDDFDKHLQELEDRLNGTLFDSPAELQNGDSIYGNGYARQTTEETQLADAQEAVSDEFEHLKASTDTKGKNGSAYVNGKARSDSSTDSNGELSRPNQSRSPKSVRFSPTVEKTTFIATHPPSPVVVSSKTEQVSMDIIDQEHLQLSMEEAFFLSYGLGVLKVMDRSTQQPISNIDLFRLCRMSSYFPPQINFTPSPDDPFLLSYVVYHHFRSLGWVVRSGIKFSVDFLLYSRGPVFSHAEFAILILPSYTHPYWSENEEIRKYVAGKEKRDWHWLHCINRVNAQVKKTLVLAYVDVPPSIGEDAESKLGIHGVLGRYRIREVVLKRWLYNRVR